MIEWAIAFAMPLSSITLPNTAPSMKTGKNDFTYVTALAINNSVYVGIIGNPCDTAAKRAKMGAKKITENPLYAKNMSKNRLRRIPSTSINMLPP
jgi:hypothetical protein